MPLQNGKAWLLEQCLHQCCGKYQIIQTGLKVGSISKYITRFKIWGAVHSVYILLLDSQVGLYPSEKKHLQDS